MTKAAGSPRTEMERSIVQRSLEDDAFRQRLLADPKAAMEEQFGTRLPEGVEVMAVKLTAGEVADMRAGTTPNPTVDKVVALSGVFGVEAGYFLDGVEEPPMLDKEALDILRDEMTSAIARKSFRLPGT